MWNAGRTLATYIESNAQELVQDRSVLELGAAAGLPSLVAALHGASNVVMTDYPDADLVENMDFNIRAISKLLSGSTITAQGYLWGDPTQPLFAALPHGASGFDTLILGDLLFNHSEHSKLITTVQNSLKKCSTSVALVFFTPYRPWLLAKDLAFFDLARDAGLKVNKILEQVMDKVMFEEDPGVCNHGDLCNAMLTLSRTNCSDVQSMDTS